jgi:LPXTG-motif cell wall-anchored protein
MLAALAILLLLPANTNLEAANAPKNFSVSFYDGEWRYQEGTSFVPGEYAREVYYLREEIKAGDYVAVYNSGSVSEVLDLGDKKLGNLTMVQCGNTVVKTAGIAECYVLGGTTAAIGGNVDKAFVYDISVVTFTGNIGELRCFPLEDDYFFHSSVGCQGTVGYASYPVFDNVVQNYEKYNFKAGKFSLEGGELTTAAADYSNTKPAAPAPAPAPDDYDEVPKTGVSSLMLYFLGASVACLGGSVALRKKSK